MSGDAFAAENFSTFMWFDRVDVALPLFVKEDAFGSTYLLCG